jgi:hypothetical protein
VPLGFFRTNCAVEFRGRLDEFNGLRLVSSEALDLRLLRRRLEDFNKDGKGAEVEVPPDLPKK